MGRRRRVIAGLAMATVLTGAAAAPAATRVGAITEYPATGLSPGAIASGPDGNVWVTDGSRSSTTVGRFTTGGALTVFQEGSGGFPNPAGAIASGPDGNLWVPGTLALVRVSPQGVFTRITAGLGQPASLPSLTIGPDGNVWYADFGFHSKAIGRVSRDGTVTEFPLDDTAFPQLIAAGPDDNLWFVDGSSSIGRMSTAGVLRTPLSGSYRLNAMALGPDGNEWVATTSTSIVRITGGETATTFTSGLNPTSGVAGIAPGPDGSVWFTQRALAPIYGGPSLIGAVGRIAPDGTITLFSGGLTSGASPSNIAPGPDGRMWFTDNGATQAVGAIGTGVPDASIAAPSITGTVRLGATLTCGGDTWSTWAGRQPLRDRTAADGYLWSRDGVPITETASATHLVTLDDRAHAITCRATVTYPLLNVTVSATSAPVTVPSPLTLRTGGVATVQRRQRARLSYTVRNTTGKPIRGLVVVSVLPKGIGLDRVSMAANRAAPPALRFTAKARRLTFRVGTLPAKAKLTLCVDAAVAANAPRGDAVNTITLTGRGVPALTFGRTLTIR